MPDQVVFQASFEDNVTPNLEKLEKQLKQMGMSPVQIKMILDSVDNATPKIKQAQQQVDHLTSKKHQLHLDVVGGAETTIAGISEELNKVKRAALSPITVPFKLLDQDGHNIKKSMDSIFRVREKIAIPLMGSLPGAGMLYGVGAGAGIAGAVTGIAGIMKDSFQINASMESQQQMLSQTLKDQQGSQREMQKIISYAQTTPFQYQDVLKANVLARSYGMPSMPGESKQVPGGFLKIASNMAATMQTTPEDAMMALAEARQGLSRRMLMYGVHMQARDFGQGGRFQGMSFDQALELATRRFQGATTAQMKTFAGISSNIKDVLQQQVLKPVGQTVFQAVEKQAFHTAGALSTSDTQAKIGTAVEKVQHLTVEIMQNLAKVHDYFDMHLKRPIELVISALIKLGKAFAQAFGGTAGLALQQVSEAIISIAEPIASITKAVPALGQVLGFMKAMQLMGMGNATKPIHDITSGHPISGIAHLPGMALRVGGFLAVKELNDAHRATVDLNNQFRNLPGHLDDINGKVAQMAANLAQSDTHMKNLVTLAAQGIPMGRMSGADRANLASQTARAGVQIGNITGLKQEDVIRALGSQMKDSNDYSVDAMHRFGTELIGLAATAREFKVSWSDVTRIMQQFAPQAAPVGLGGIAGAGALTSLATGVNQFGVTAKQTAQGLYTPDAVLTQMLSSYRTPTASDLSKMGVGNIGKYWQFAQKPGDIGRYTANVKSFNDYAKGSVGAENQAQSEIATLAPSARNLVRPVPEPWITGKLGVNIQALRGSTPQQTAENVGNAWIKSANNVNVATKAYGDLGAKISLLQAQVTSYTQAQAAVDLQMQAGQHAIQLLQRGVEDASLSLQKYTFDNLRPLERELTRVSNAMDVVNHTMSDAQYNMTKFADGLLTGEQAALNQLHALSLYNEQLNYLKMQYTQIGAQLGTQVYERGFSARVQPLMGLSLEMQMQQLQRKQQMEQSRYDITYGEGHYQMQQAQRTKWQRTEMPLDQRIAGITQNQGIIDKSTIQAHNLGNVQFDLQQKMFKVNEVIADQTDNITKLQIAVTAAQQSPAMRSLEDQQYNLAQAVGKANIEITRQQSLQGKWQNALTDIRQQAQDLQTLFTSLMHFPSGGKGAAATAHRAINEALASGLIDKKEAGSLNKMVDQGQAASQKAIDQHRGWQNTQAPVGDRILKNVEGVFTGDTFRKLADLVKGVPGVGAPASSLLQGAGTIAPFLSILIAATVASGTAIWGLKTLATKILPLDSVGRILGSAATDASRIPKVGRLFTGFTGLAESGALADRLSGSLWKNIAAKFEPILHPIQEFRGIALRALGGGIGFAVGGPVGGGVGAMAGGAFDKHLSAHDKTLTSAARELSHGAKDIRGGAHNFATGVHSQVANATSTLRTNRGIVNDMKDHVGKFGDDIKGKAGLGATAETMATEGKKFGSRIANFGSEIGRFGGFVGRLAVIGTVVAELKTLLDHLLGTHTPKGVPHPRVRPHGRPNERRRPDAADEHSPHSSTSEHRSNLEGTPSEAHPVDSSLQGQVQKLIGKLPAPLRKAISVGRTAVKWGGRALAIGSFIPAVKAMASGHMTKGILEAGNALTYLTPGLGEAHMLTDLLQAITGQHTIAGALGADRVATGADIKTLNRSLGIAPGQPIRGFPGTSLGAIGQHPSARSNVGRINTNDFLSGSKQLFTEQYKLFENHFGRTQALQLASHSSMKKLQDQYNKLSISDQKRWISLTGQQQMQGEQAALTGPKGLQNYLNSIENGLTTHWNNRIKLVADGYTAENNTHNDGYKAISGTSGSWLKTLEGQIKDWSKKMGLPFTEGKGGTPAAQGVASAVAVTTGVVSAISTTISGFEHGGIVKADPHKDKLGQGRIVRMVEEGHPEVVIPLAPHRRDRARQLLDQTKGLVGYANGGYVNPMGGITGITPERIDMGVDYSFPVGSVLKALGDAHVNVAGSSGTGWPGGGYINMTLGDGPMKGRSWYVAENIMPLIQSGSNVTAGQPIAKFVGGPYGTEWGWASGPINQTLAAALNEQSHGSDPGANTSAAGVSFANFLASLGAPRGIQGGPVVGDLKHLPFPNTIAGGGNVTPIHLKGAPAGLLNKGIIGKQQHAILNHWKKKWEKHLDEQQLPGEGGGTFSGKALGDPSKVSSKFSANQRVFISTLAQVLGQSPRTIGAWLAAEEPVGASSGYRGTQDWLNIGITDQTAGSGGLGANNSVWQNAASAAQASGAWIKGTWSDPGFGKAAGSIQALSKIGNNPSQFFNALANSGWASNGYGGAGALMNLYNTGYAVGSPRISRDQIAPVHQDEMIVPAAMAHAARAMAGRGHAAPTKKTKLADDSSWLAFYEKFTAIHKSAQAIQDDIHKVQKHLTQDKTPQTKKEDTDRLKGLNAQLRARNQQFQTTQHSYQRAIARNLVAVHDPSSGESTVAGVQAEQHKLAQSIYTWTHNTPALQRARKVVAQDHSRITADTKKLRADEAKLRRDRAHHASRAVLTKDQRNIHADKARLARDQHKLVIDEKSLRRLEALMKKIGPGLGQAHYIVGAAERGVNAGLIKAITGKNLNKDQLNAYKKLEEATRHSGKMTAEQLKHMTAQERAIYDKQQAAHTKLVHTLEQNLLKSLAGHATKASNERKALHGTAKGIHANTKHSADGITKASTATRAVHGAVKAHTTQVTKLTVGTHTHLGNIYTGVTDHIKVHQALDSITHGHLINVHKAVRGGSTEVAKHHVTVGKHEASQQSHMTKTEAHQGKLESKLDALISKIDRKIEVTVIAPPHKHRPAPSSSATRAKSK